MLLAMSLGEELPERRADYDPFDPEEMNQQDSEQYTLGGALIVEAQDDLDVAEVELAALPPSRGRRTKNSDLDRYFRWQLDRELEAPGARLDRILRADIQHVRTHRELGRLVDEVIHKTGLQNGASIVAFDAEGIVNGENPALVQVAMPGLTAVIQLRSKQEGTADVFREGYPNRLRELLLLPNVIFAGQAIIRDIRGLAWKLGMATSEIGGLLIIDTGRLFTLADALSRDGPAVEDWLDRREVTAVGKVGDVSLKNFCQFVKPAFIIDKAPYHRNNNAEFEEQNGEIRDAALCYAALDARRTLEAVEDFAELIGVRPSRLASSAADLGRLEDCSLEAALRIFASNYGSPLPERLPVREEMIVSKLRENVNRVRERMAAAQKNILRFRAYKKMLCRKMRVEREKIKVEKAIEIQIIAPHSNRVFLPSPVQVAGRRPTITTTTTAAPPPPMTTTTAPMTTTAATTMRSETHPDPDAPGRATTATPEPVMDVVPTSQPTSKPKRGKRRADENFGRQLS